MGKSTLPVDLYNLFLSEIFAATVGLRQETPQEIARHLVKTVGPILDDLYRQGRKDAAEAIKSAMDGWYGDDGEWRGMEYAARLAEGEQ